VIRSLRRTWNRLLGSLTGKSRENDLAEELKAHIEMLAEENIRRGVPPGEAHRRARLQFGSVESTKESYRDQRGLPVVLPFSLIAAASRRSMCSEWMALAGRSGWLQRKMASPSSRTRGHPTDVRLLL